MKKVLSMFVVLLMSTMMWGANSSVPENAPDVMLQAFYWDSYPSNSSNLGYGNTGWSALLNQADELGEYFDLVWLPPCSQSSGGTGYIPKQYSNLNSDWGSETQLRELISKLKAKNTRCVADIVVNHITGNYGWCSFATMDFGDYGKFYPEASWICQTDEMNYEASAGTCQGKATGANDDGYGDEANYTAARDWDHKNSQVQAMCRAYLKWLKNDVGFDGWRYDYGKGFHHSHINDYNSAAGAYMSVVEYWDGNPGVIRSRLEDAQWNNMAFDFGTKYDAINNGICSFNYGKCKGAGMLGAGLSKHAVTFVDNHDTFQRNNSEFGGQGNSMLSNFKDRLLQANAYILSMPGIPCVFYPHWVTYKSEIKAMIEARHLVGVHSQSEVKDEYAEEGGYQVTVVGSKGYLILQLGNKVGGSFDGFTKKAFGNGYAMWIMTNTPVEHTYTVAGNSADVFGTAWAPSFEANDMIKQDDGSYKWEKSDLVLKAGTIELKVCEDHGWDVSYPAENYQLKIDAAGTYTITITFNAETKAISATATKTADADPGDEPGDDPQPAEKDSIFLVNAKAWATPTVHLWGGTAAGTTWPGVAMTKVSEKINGYDVYKYVADKGAYKNCIFNNAGADQTADLDWTSGKYYYIDKWYAKEDIPSSGDPGSGDDPQPADKDSIFLVNAKAWATPTVHLWGGTAAGTTWPGVAMTKVNEKINGYDVYKYVADKGAYKSCIFNNAGADQTADLDWTSGKYYYIDKWYAKEDIPASEDPGSGDDPQPATAKFYITGDSALVVDAGLEKAQAWNPAAIKSETDTFELSLKADQYYVLKVTLNGTWEGENNVKGYNELTEKADGLVDDGSDHNIGFKLSEAGKVQVIYTVMDNKTIFKLAGKFVTEGSGSGDDPQPGTKYFMKNNWNGGAEWSWKEMTAAENNTFKLEKVVFGGTGVNYNTAESDDGAEWIAVDAFAGDEIGALDTVTFVLDLAAEKKVKAILLGKYNEGQGGGDDPQPGTKYFMKNNWNGGAEWSWKEMTAAENNTFKLEKVVFGGTGVNYNTAESDEGAEWVAADAFAGDEIGALDTVTFVLDLAAEKKVKAFLLGKYNEGQGGGDDPQPGTKYFMKNNWNGGAEWSWKEMTAAENNTFKLEKVVFGGTGVNYNTAESDEGAEWVAADAFAGDEIGALDTVTFVLDLAAEKKVKAILLGKYNEGQGGGDDPQPATAKFYITGDSALVVDAGLDKAKAWNPAAIKSEKDTFELDLKADQYYVLKVTLNGTWEGENNVKGYNELTEKADGLVDDGSDHNIGFKLSEAGKVQVIYTTDKDNKTVFKLVGKFVTEGSGSGDDPQPAAAKFYITGDSALVVDAGLDKAKAWNPAAIKSETDTFELSLKADQYYVLKVTLNGTWEGENNVKGYNELTEKTEGLVDDSNDHNIGFKLSEAGKVQVIYTIDKDNKTVFKLAGKFVTEGSGSGDDPQPGTKYFMKNNWNGGAEWSWKEMTAAENNTFKLEKVVFGGTGVNYNTAESDEGAEWVAADAFAGDEIGALDTVTFVLDLAAEKKVKAFLLGKYNEGQGGGDDPQPGTKYFMKNNWNGGAEWSWKEMTASESNTFKLEKVVFGGTGVNYNTAESDEGAEWVAIDALDGDEIGALDTVTFVLDLAAEKKVKAILLGKYNEGQGGGDDPQPGENVTVYFVNNVNWEAVNAYVWVGEGDAYKQWPGEALTKETAQAGVAKREAEQHQGYDIYSYTFPSKYVNIIFNNGSVQTVDLTWNAAKPYFYPDGAEGSKVKGTWYAKEEIPSGGEPIVKPEDGYYLLGTFNSWTPAAEYLFKANPDKANEYYLSVTLAVDDKLKVAKVEDGAAKTWYPDGMDNDYVVDAAHAGAKVVYFQTTYNAEWEAFGGYFYIASDTGTGVDNIQSGATYQKFIENGQLFILRDGRIYTPAGQFVR